MNAFVGIFAMSFILSVVTTAAVRHLALSFGVVDEPDSFRKIHVRAIPRLGGVAVYVAFLTPLVVLYFHPFTSKAQVLQQGPWQFLGLIVGASLAMDMGVVDDIRGLRARWKLLFQALAGTVAFFSGFAIDSISVPFGGGVALGLLSLPVTLFWFIGCMNAINLLDGLDGLAAGTALFVSITLFMVGLQFGNVLSMFFMCCLGGAVLGFLLFNFHPARIFLGDSGSMLLGFLIGALSLLSARKAEAAVALLIPFIALGVPIFDTSLAILRRWSKGLPLAAPDRGHLHHVLLSLGLNHRTAVLSLYLACMALGAAALLIAAGRNMVTIVVLGTLLITTFVCARMFGGLRLLDLLKRISADFNRQQRVSDAKIAVERAVARMKEAKSAPELWGALTSTFESLDLDHAMLRLGAAGEAQTVLHWSGHRGQERSKTELWMARLKVRYEGRELGDLEVDCNIEEALPLPNIPDLVDRLRREIAAQIGRMAAMNGNGLAPNAGKTSGGSG